MVIAQDQTLQRIEKLLLRIVELLELISVQMPQEEGFDRRT